MARSKRFKTRIEAIKWKRSLDVSIDNGKPAVSAKAILVKKIIEEYLAYRSNSRKPLQANQITEYGNQKAGYSISKLLSDFFTQVPKQLSANFILFINYNKLAALAHNLLPTPQRNALSRSAYPCVTQLPNFFFRGFTHV